MIELEKGILANALTNLDYAFSLIEKGNIFQNKQHQIVYETIKNCIMDKIPPTQITVSHNKEIAQKTIIDIMTSKSITLEHDFIMNKLYLDKRKNNIIVEAKNFIIDVGKGQEDVERFINNITLEQTESVVKNFGDVTNYEISETFGKDGFITTGLDPLDEVIIGIGKTDFIVIAGKPGAGKTTLALNIAYHHKGTLIYSYEMTAKREIYAKTLSYLTGIDSTKILQNSLNKAECEKIESAKQLVRDLNFRVCDKPLPFGDLMASIRNEIRIKKPPLIIIDYLQRISGIKGNNRNDQIELMTMRMKDLTMEEGIPLIILSQLSKDGYKTDSAPTMADLRGSGSIAQDANTIIFCHDDSLVIAKARMSVTGKVNNITFDKPRNRFLVQDQDFRYK